MEQDRSQGDGGRPPDGGSSSTGEGSSSARTEKTNEKEERQGPEMLRFEDLDAVADDVVGFQAADTAGVPIEVESSPDEEEVDLEEDAFDLDVDVDADGEPADSAALEELRQEKDVLARELEEVRTEATETQQRLLRVAADLENYRKRMERERKEDREQALSGFLRDMLPVVDNLTRALDQAAATEDPPDVLTAFTEGVQLIQQQLFDTLKSAGVEPIDTSGAFDPAFHEAMMQETSTEAPHMAILDVFEKGYVLRGRLLRPAKVRVCHNPDGVAEAPADDDDSAAGHDEGGSDIGAAEDAGAAPDAGTEQDAAHDPTEEAGSEGDAHAEEGGEDSGEDDQ